MDAKMNVSALQKLFNGIHNSKGFHIICFEDIDRCEHILERDSDFIRFFINELDGVVETTKRITFFTTNDKSVLERIPALMRVGRIDKKVELTYCTDEQIVRLFNHYSYSEEKLELKEFNIQITPAEMVDVILNNNNISPYEFELKLKNYEKIDEKVPTFIQPKNIRKRLTKLEQFEKNKKEILKLEKANEKLYSILTEQDLISINKKLKAQEKLIESSSTKLDNFKEILNNKKLNVDENDDETDDENTFLEEEKDEEFINENEIKLLKIKNLLN